MLNLIQYQQHIFFLKKAGCCDIRAKEESLVFSAQF